MRFGARGLDDAYLERLLFLSAQQARLLSDVRKMRVRAALLAENLRLAKSPAPANAPVFVEDARRREAVRTAATRVQRPWLFRSLAIPAAATLTIGAYAWLGGQPGPARATIDGSAIIHRHRTGLLGITWRIPDSHTMHASTAARVGDRITASSALTLTYPDGTVTRIERGTELVIEVDGVALQRGAIEAQVTPRQSGQPRYAINSPAGTLTVKGTTFRAETTASGALLLQTFEGVVSARNEIGEAAIRTGEQVMLRKGDAPIVALQVPRLTLPGRSSRRLLTNDRKVPFSARIVPKGALIAIDQSGREIARFTADAQGAIETALTADERRPLRVRFLQEYADASARSQLSDPLEIVFDQSAPALQVNPYQRSGDAFVISGQARTSDTLTINGAAIKLDSVGAFTHTLALATGQTQIEVISRDAAGTVTRIVQDVAR
jgi:hypothetical protein